MEYCSEKEREIVSELLTRFLQCTRNIKVYSYKVDNPFKDVFLKNNFQIMCQDDSGFDFLENQIICIYDDGQDEYAKKLIQKYKEFNYIIVLREYLERELEQTKWGVIKRKILFEGLACCKTSDILLENFKVLAIIHVYNEEDIVRQVTEYLLSQGVDIYLLDNWSTDLSYSIIQSMVREYPGRVFCERFPAMGKTDYYDWYHQLQRSEDLSYELDYDWYIHYDADEYRISPWQNITLKEAIYYIDSLGFNLIENTVIDFKVTDESDESIFMRDVWFDFGHRPAHFEQIKTWKKCEIVDLKSSGGHIAKISDPKIFPLKILNRHYPLRSWKHAQKKIFVERKPRFVKENQERGWHGHYDSVVNKQQIIMDTEGLIKWGEDTFDTMYIPLFTGIGVEVYGETKCITYEDLSDGEDNKEICLFGAGVVGKLLYSSIKAKYNVVHWVDNKNKFIPALYGRIIESPQVLGVKDGVLIWIAVEKEDIAREIRDDLIKNGIRNDCIVWKKLELKNENRISTKNI